MKWRYGGIVHQADWYGNEVDDYYIIDGTTTQDNDLGYEYKVYPETVGQYTGLTDKKGKKIFEGDIIKSDKFIGVVEYNSVIAAFIVKINDSTDNWYHWSPLNEGDITRREQLQYTEVIGNIHDKPKEDSLCIHTII